MRLLMSHKPPVRVKICGITNFEDALFAARLGADALGFIFYPKSPRYISPREARLIKAELPPFITTVGVFVDERAEQVRDVASEVGLGVVQLHGLETPAYCATLGLSVIKALRVRDETDIRSMVSYKVSAFLLDTYREGQMGGTGQVFDWDLAVKALSAGGKSPIILSGGLNPDNVAEAVDKVGPYAVDVSSGVESRPGIKDKDLVCAFIKRAKK